MWKYPHFLTDLVTFTEEIPKEKFHILRSVLSDILQHLTEKDFGKN